MWRGMLLPALGYPCCCCIKQAGCRRLNGSLGGRQNSSNVDPRWSCGGAALEPCSTSSLSHHSSASSSSTSSLGRPPPHGANENHCGRHLQKKVPKTHAEAAAHVLPCRPQAR
uniref:Uncharacterized protein n=1 Tax=Arundo donax TaxID=35708 RepID=A0A0A9GNN7_ARUDO